MTVLLPIFSLLLSVSFLLMGHGLMGTLLPLRGLADGFSSVDLGVLGAVYFLGFGAGTVIGPRAIGRVGHIRAFTAMAAIICIAVTIQGLAVAPWSWWITRALTGFCLATLYVVIESWLNATSTNANRGMVFSVYTVINLAVITIGQMLTASAEITGVVLFSVATMLFAASMVPISLTRRTAPTPARTVTLRIGYLWRLSPVAVVGGLAVGFTNGAFWTLGPIFAQRQAGDVGMVAIFMSVTVLSGALGQLPIGWLSDRLDRRIVIAITGAGAVLAAIAQVLAAWYWPAGLLPCAALFGAFALPLYSVCAAHLNDYIEEDGYVEAASGMLLLYAIGAVIGPVTASGMVDLYGTFMLFVFTAIIHLGLVVFALGRIRHKSAPQAADKMAFTETLITAGTVANLDPRPDGGESGHASDSESRPEDG